MKHSDHKENRETKLHKDRQSDAKTLEHLKIWIKIKNIANVIYGIDHVCNIFSNYEQRDEQKLLKKNI